jgi:hypothetical protein
VRRAHEIGHRVGVLTGAIKKKLVTREDGLEAEKFAWSYAASEMKKAGTWGEYEKDIARRGFSGHGYGQNFKTMEKLMEEIDA